MELEDLVKLKERNPRTGFVYIFHSTKDGRFRGGNELAHEVDVIIEVYSGKASGNGRYGNGELTVNI
jgi:predicted ATP-dependent serine protease